jgi:undecaprenyl-diphosphatase
VRGRRLQVASRVLLIQAFVLGLVQGATEFIPVSSSGHLKAIPFLVGWEPGSLAFDVALHVGTLVAVVAYFRTDLWAMLRAVLRPGAADAQAVGHRRLVAVLAVASVPAAAVGLLARDVLTAAFEEPLAIAGFLALTALLLWASERRRTTLGTVEPAADDAATVARELDALPWTRALGVGAAQALAIFPGVSRSGATIAAGMTLGLSRGAAARLSFLMLLPITVGAALVTLPELGTVEPGTLPFGPLEIALGVAVSAISGYLAIRFLIALVARRSLLLFARYVLVLAIVLAAVALVRG